MQEKDSAQYLDNSAAAQIQTNRSYYKGKVLTDIISFEKIVNPSLCGLKEGKKNIKELQDLILKQYMTEVISPIVDSIEGNLYIGKFDFMDCSQPTSTYNV